MPSVIGLIIVISNNNLVQVMWDMVDDLEWKGTNEIAKPQIGNKV